MIMSGEPKVSHSKVIKDLFDHLYTQATTQGNKSYTSYFACLDSNFPEVGLLKSGCELSPGLFEMEGEMTVYHQAAASIASLVCALQARLDEESMNAAMMIMGVTTEEDKNVYKEGVPIWTKAQNNIAEEDQGWLMIVMTLLNRLEKSFEVNKQVWAWEEKNKDAHRPANAHYRVLRTILGDKGLSQKLAPTYAQLTDREQHTIQVLFSSRFQVTQLIQGELTPMSLMHGDELRESMQDNSFHQFLYQYMFQAQGGAARKEYFPTRFITSLANYCSKVIESLKDIIAANFALQRGEGGGQANFPAVVVELSVASEALLSSDTQLFLQGDTFLQGVSASYRMYYKCLLQAFTHRVLNNNKDLKDRFNALPLSFQLPVMRIMAMTRYGYKNLECLMSRIPLFQDLVDELNGSQVRTDLMLMFGPDLAQSWLGVSPDGSWCSPDPDGAHMIELLHAMELLYSKARTTIIRRKMKQSIDGGGGGECGIPQSDACNVSTGGEDSFVLNVKPLISELEARGAEWANEKKGRLIELVDRAIVQVSASFTHGLIAFKPMRITNINDVIAIVKNLNNLLEVEPANMEMRKILNCSYVLRQSLIMKGESEQQLMDALVEIGVAVWKPMLKILSQDFLPPTVKRNCVDILTVLSFCESGMAKLLEIGADSTLERLLGMKSSEKKYPLQIESARKSEHNDGIMTQSLSLMSDNSALETISDTEAELRKNAENLLWKLKMESGAVDALSNSILPRGTHVMLSYSWGPRNPDGTFLYQEYMKVLCKELQAVGVKVWMDVNDMRGNIVDSMSDAVDNAYLVICGFSSNYAASINCRMELEYARNRSKKIKYIKMEEGFTPSGWLGMYMGAEMYTNFWNMREVNKHLQKLITDVSAMSGRNLSSRGGSASSHQEPHIRAGPIIHKYFDAYV